MKKILNILFALATITLCACNDWLNVGPKNERSEDDLFSSGDGYEAALNGIYECLAEQGLYGQELTWGFLSAAAEDYDASRVASSTYKDAANHSYNTTNTEPVVSYIWERMYKAIANCNNLIQNIQGADPEMFEYNQYEKNVILGEAYALRGMIHFDLLRLFAPAPVVAGTKTYIPYQEVHPTIVGMPLSVPDFMNKVIEDLKRGKDLTATMDTLPEFNGFISSVSNRLEAYGSMTGFFGFRSTRLNYYNCTCLLARAYQYAGQSENALKEAKEMYGYFNSYPFSSGHSYYSDIYDNDINTRDLKSHEDIMFALFNSNEITYCREYNEGGLYGRLYLRNPDELFGGESIDDSRYQQLITFENTTTKTGPTSLKWYESSDNTIARTIHPLIPMFRMAEIYYILAEETFDTDPAAAVDYLAEVRAGRDVLASLQIPESKSAFQRVILNDAAREWIAEGQLFFMKKRLNILDADAGIPAGATINYVLPIPTSNTVF